MLRKHRLPVRVLTRRPPRAQHHEIGQGYALFYEARAAFLELRGNFSLAHGVYERGISRCDTAPAVRCGMPS